MKQWVKGAVILAAIGITFFGCSGKKTMISLDEAGNMTEEQLKQELSGFSREEIAAAWGDPKRPFFGVDGEVFVSDEGKTLMVYYGNSGQEIQMVKLGEISQVFEGTIKEINGTSALIAVDEGFPIRNSGDLVSVTLDENMASAQVGDRVSVAYSGEVKETYPLQLSNQKQIQWLEKEEFDRIPMVMVNGNLYQSVGETSDIEGRCGGMDGEITSSVDGTKIPLEDGQSNFGVGYSYQFVDKDHIDLYMPFGDLDKWNWVRFERVGIHESTVNEAGVNDFPGVTMTILEATKTDVKVELLNTTDREVCFGEEYALQEFVDGEWVSVPYLVDNWAFTSIGYTMPKGKPVEWETNWEGFHGMLEPGRYRLVKPVMDFRGTGDFTQYKLTGEFEVTGDNGEEALPMSIRQEPPALWLQDALSSTYSKIDVTSGNYTWYYRTGNEDEMTGESACGSAPLDEAKGKERLNF